MKENIIKEKSSNKSKNSKGIATNFAKTFGVPKKWYEELSNDPKDFLKVTDTKLIELKDEAKKCHDAEVARYSIKNSKTNSDYQWMKTVMAKGTISDKVAAYTILIQDDPVCNLSTIQNLISMVKVGKKKECLVVMDTLTNLFVTDLLIPDKKLKAFHERPLSKLDEISSGNAGTRRKYLSIWYFEDQLKESFTQYVLALNKAAHDTVETNKEKAISAMYRLLSSNPEQEKNLLANIVNKLGDPSQKVASKAIYCLGQLLHNHPAMKQVVLNEIEKLLFRSNVSNKSQYYGICFLTQFYLSHEDYDLAKNLIDVYFSFFKACVKKGDVDSRMMSALLMGVNRAYPYAKTELSKISEHINTMYKVVHIAKFNVSLHTLNLLFQVSDLNNSISDRFYSALYKKILDPNVAVTTHQALLLNLIFRALKKDTIASRIMAFIKRLLQISLFMQPPMACGILFLVFHILNKKSNLLANKIKTDILDDDKPEHYNDVKIEDNSENKELKDQNPENKNIQQEELEDKTPIDLNETVEDDIKPDEEKLNETKPVASWVHTDISIKSEYNHPPVTCYNPQHRNPRYAGGEFCVYTELLQLQKHFHPTVALFATKILNEDSILYSGDPLKDFTMIRFLERFSFKNPKKIEDIKKPGINPVFGRRKLYVPEGMKSQPVISNNYVNANEDKIPVEEMFLYKYLRKQYENKNVEDDEDGSDADSVASEEFEEMLSKMGGGKHLLDDDDEDLDFMKDVGESLKNTENDADSDEDLSAEENEFSDNEFDEMDGKEVEEDNDSEDNLDDDDLDNELSIDDLDDDGSDIEFNDDDDDGSDEDDKKIKSKTNKKKNKNDVSSLFASADDFAAILDEEPDFMAGTSHAVSNKDKAHKKQLAWEQDRHRWIHKGDNESKKKKKHKFNPEKKNQGKKRQHNKQAGNKKKKQKR